MRKTPTRASSNEDEQDDPENIAEIERLRAKLARYKREAERLAEVLRRKDRS